MGGPDTLADVRPFLFNLFSDREIIKLGPAFLQPLIAWFIARKRAPKSRAIYELIGGGSPLKKITMEQAKALENALAADGDYLVRVAMRYWPPYASDAVNELVACGCKRITALSLYPHYSKATTGSSLKALQAHLKKAGSEIQVDFIESWPSQQLYTKTLAANILETVEQFAPARPEVVYSAHSLPVSFIEEGDPYVRHIEATIAAVEEHTGMTGHLCYQSRSGPVVWLSPSTPEMLKKLAAKGCKKLVMVPISFVSDHVETLCEINIEYRDLAASLGMELRPSPSLNCNPGFIAALRELVLEKNS